MNIRDYKNNQKAFGEKFANGRYEITGNGGIKITGNLLCHNNQLTSLPDNLTVGGNLYCYNNQLTSLPDNLTVGGNLECHNNQLTSLPDNLTVGGSLYCSYNQLTSLPDDLTVEDNLNCSDNQLTSLPDDLTVGGSLYCFNNQLTSLPDNLTVGGNLDCSDNQLTSLPDNLTVGCGLYCYNNQLTSLPDNLTVGGNLYCYNNQLTSLPDNLTVGGDLHCYNNQLTSIQITHFKRHNYTQGETGHNWIYADGILSIIKSKRQIGKYTYYQGKHRNSVITDGVNWAHCKDLRTGIIDLQFKAEKRDVSDYEGLTLDSEVSYEDAVIMYRIITGACSAGTNEFLSRMKPEQIKDKYKISEICEITDGAYGSDVFRKFFRK